MSITTQNILNGANVVANLCLYGTQATGAGWILETKAGGIVAGDGVPSVGRSFTSAVYLAVQNLKDLGVRDGILRIFHPGGEFVSAVDLRKAVPSYGSLVSVPAAESDHLKITVIG